MAKEVGEASKVPGVQTLKSHSLSKSGQAQGQHLKSSASLKFAPCLPHPGPVLRDREATCDFHAFVCVAVNCKEVPRGKITGNILTHLPLKDQNFAARQGTISWNVTKFKGSPVQVCELFLHNFFSCPTQIRINSIHSRKSQSFLPQPQWRRIRNVK